jgi:hypothetical protein
MIECVRFTSSDVYAVFFQPEDAKSGPLLHRELKIIFGSILHPLLETISPEKCSLGSLTGCGMVNDTIFFQNDLPDFWANEKT